MKGMRVDVTDAEQAKLLAEHLLITAQEIITDTHKLHPVAFVVSHGVLSEAMSLKFDTTDLEEMASLELERLTRKYACSEALIVIRADSEYVTLSMSGPKIGFLTYTVPYTRLHGVYSFGPAQRKKSTKPEQNSAGAWWIESGNPRLFTDFIENRAN